MGRAGWNLTLKLISVQCTFIRYTRVNVPQGNVLQVNVHKHFPTSKCPTSICPNKQMSTSNLGQVIDPTSKWPQENETSKCPASKFPHAVGFTDFRPSDFRLLHICRPPLAYLTFACRHIRPSDFSLSRHLPIFWSILNIRHVPIRHLPIVL